MTPHQPCLPPVVWWSNAVHFSPAGDRWTVCGLPLSGTGGYSRGYRRVTCLKCLRENPGGAHWNILIELGAVTASDEPAPAPAAEETPAPPPPPVVEEEPRDTRPTDRPTRIERSELARTICPQSGIYIPAKFGGARPTQVEKGDGSS